MGVAPDFVDCPPSATVEFVRRTDITRLHHRPICVDQFTFALGLEHIATDKHRFKICEPKFFVCFASEGIVNLFTEVNVAADGSVPLSGLDVLPLRSLLQIKSPIRIKHMEVYDRMKQHAPPVTFSPRRLPDNLPLFIYHGKLFPAVILSHYNIFLKLCRWGRYDSSPNWMICLSAVGDAKNRVP